jgi:hypothetical protein
MIAQMPTGWAHRALIVESRRHLGIAHCEADNLRTLRTSPREYTATELQRCVGPQHAKTDSGVAVLRGLAGFSLVGGGLDSPSTTRFLGGTSHWSRTRRATSTKRQPSQFPGRAGREWGIVEVCFTDINATLLLRPLFCFPWIVSCLLLQDGNLPVRCSSVLLVSA